MASKCTQYCKYSKIYCFVIQGPNSHLAPQTKFVINDLSLSEISQLSQLYLEYYHRGNSETAYLVPQFHLLMKVYVWLRSVSNARHFTWRTGTFLAVSRLSLEGFSKQLLSLYVNLMEKMWFFFDT